MISNSELWKLAEVNRINRGDVFIDQDGNEMIFTGKAFQVYFTEKDERYDYVGMCIGDEWKFSHNDMAELEKQTKERR
ncbi:hypothetical protein IMZ31_20190 (plasmid) [Pontibacillus sp. ALD_SL1]|uniref:hypothetical protein n=1 Tax=Pontibacillus sp. ALD_SL1 TaxID=2777185 RepID=UPI001A964AFD|nr:hypothetical protein [Pontibacillus sp. ALD_SL1]QST02872.1 hypothetical protein IMZ31_20190 [Pontibacillus sp. ALD_SL1]